MILREYLRNSAKRYPNNNLFVIDEKEFSYLQIYEKSLRLSNSLKFLKINEKSKFVIYLPRCIEQYISMLGVLEHASAYIPVDISSPPGRTSFVVQDSKADVLLCRKSDIQKISIESLNTLKLIILVDTTGSIQEKISTQIVSWNNLFFDVPTEDSYYHDETEEDLAYILYTSGSTGSPKGVAISHRAASCFIDWACTLVNLSSKDRVSNHASLSFDLSVFDIFSSIKAGATIYPVPGWPIGSGYLFAKFIEKNQITIWYSVPTILSRIAHEPSVKEIKLTSLRTVVFAGEPFPKKDLIRFSKLVPDAELYNWYGPTETNVCAYHHVTCEDLQNDSPLPIGTACPYSNLRIIPDEDNSRGELFVSGHSLMSGYYRNGIIDRSSFFSKENGIFFYPTGDIFSQNQETFIFHGRKDLQIKKHGFRIELSEIEIIASEIESVSEAIAILSENFITLFFTLDNKDSKINEQYIRNILLDLLPPYMIPDKIILINEMPRNDRGKINRKLLQCHTHG